MLNKVFIIGRLGKDPELRYAANGAPFANFNVATDDAYTDKDGNRVERTEWHRIVVFQRQAENCANYLSKGSLVFVEGTLQTRKWQDQQGQDRYTTEIRASRVQFLDRKGSPDTPSPYDGAPRSQGGENHRQQTNRRPQQQSQPNYDDDLGPAFPSEASGMDDVPF